MFQFHGWLSIEVDDQDDPDLAILDERMDLAVSALRRKIALVEDDFSVFEVRQAGNGLCYVAVHGLRNHRYTACLQSLPVGR